MNDSGIHVAEFLASGAGKAILALLAALMATWIAFPLIALSYLGKIRRELAEIKEKVIVIRGDTVKIEANTR